MSSIKLSPQDQQTCHQVAREAIRYGLEHGKKIVVKPEDYTLPLQQNFATFVTLHKHGDLRGCIGTLEAYQPLIMDVAEHAYAAAFSDPRFSPLTQSELDQVEIEISVLSTPEGIEFKDEEDLVNKIRPGVDGLILEHGFNRGTFLPSVWEQIPDKREFLTHLKMKAGLPASWWNDNVKISRYETLLF